MLYTKHHVRANDTVTDFIVERDTLLTIEDVNDRCERWGICEELPNIMTPSGAVDMDALTSINVKQTHKDISEDEFAFTVLDGKCQLVDSVRSMCHPQVAFMNIYQLCPEDMSEKPCCYWFEADCGQDTDVDYIAIVDKDHPQNEVCDAAWDDIIYQLRRYCKIGAWNLMAGLFHISRLTPEDYEEMRKERGFSRA